MVKKKHEFDLFTIFVIGIIFFIFLISLMSNFSDNSMEEISGEVVKEVSLLGPERFYGKFGCNVGTLEAYVGNLKYNIEIIDSYYGYNKPFYVSSVNEGDLIEFFINGEKVGESEFISYGVKELDFECNEPKYYF